MPTLKEFQRRLRSLASSQGFEPSCYRAMLTHAEMAEQLDSVDDILRIDPAGVYPAMDFETRDRYCRTVEALAERSDTTAVEVARRAIRMAAAWAGTDHEPIDARQRHVGYYLIDRARAVLEEAIGYEPTRRERIARFLLRHATASYLGSIGLLTLLMVGCVMGLTAAAGSIMLCLAAGVLALLPASEVAVQFVNYFVTTQLSPHTLPKLEFHDGIPASCATMVVVPSLLLNEKEVAGLLERHY